MPDETWSALLWEIILQHNYRYLHKCEYRDNERFYSEQFYLIWGSSNTATLLNGITLGLRYAAFPFTKIDIYL